MNDKARRLASIVAPLAELEELIESVCYVLDRFDSLSDARPRLLRATETALPLIRLLVDAAQDDLEELYYESFEDDSRASEPSP
jgi:hypothetical protein